VTRPRIYMQHGEAYGNLGDEAMLVNAVRRIQARLGPCEFVLPCQPGRPLPAVPGGRLVPAPRLFLSWLSEHSGRAGMLSRRAARRLPWDMPWRACAALQRHCAPSGVPASGWPRFLASLATCDAIYCVGAANMNENTRRNALLTKWLLVQHGRRLRIPVIVSSQGLGPLRTRWALECVVETLQSADHFSLRDHGPSRELLRDAGVSSSRILEVGDEAFSLPPSDVESARAFLVEAHVDPDRPFGVVHFRGTDYIRPTRRHYPALAAALDGLSEAVQIVFLPMSYGHRTQPDLQCARAIRDRMSRPHRLRLLRCPDRPQVARRLVGMAAWVVSLSYHLQVFALAGQVPMIPLISGPYYRQKARGILGWTGDVVKPIDLDRTPVKDIGGKLGGLLERAGKQRETLRAARARIEKVNDLPLRALARAIGTQRTGDPS